MVPEMEVRVVCEEIYTIPTATLVRIHAGRLFFGVLIVIVLFGLLLRGVNTIRKRLTISDPGRWDWVGSVYWVFFVIMTATLSWAAWDNVVHTTRFTIDGPSIRAIEVETLRYDPQSMTTAYPVERTTVLDDPADLCHLIRLLREAEPRRPPGSSSGRVIYNVWFVRTDGSRSVYGLKVWPTDRYEEPENRVILHYHRRSIGNTDLGVFTSPAITEWVMSKAK